jgi:outer membrane lipoprotein-sorting protein
MKRILAVATLVAVAATGFAVTGEEILERIDELSTFVDADFASVMTMITEDPEEGVEKMVVQQFRRDDEDQFVLIFREPEIQKGQGYLRVDDSLWFYDPESRQFSFTSMKEQFGGSDARNSDFGASSLAEDYDVTSMTEGTLGNFQVYILDLEAVNNEVTYAQMKIWVTRDNFLVLKSEDYSEAGRLLRTSLFPNYARAGQTFIPTRMIFVDELVEGKKTQIALSDISLASIPDSVFTKAYIERVNR